MFTFVYRSDVTREKKFIWHTSGGWHREQSLIVAARDEARHRCEECMTLLRCWRLWQKVCMSLHVCKSEQSFSVNRRVTWLLNASHPNMLDKRAAPHRLENYWTTSSWLCSDSKISLRSPLSLLLFVDVGGAYCRYTWSNYLTCYTSAHLLLLLSSDLFLKIKHPGLVGQFLCDPGGQVTSLQPPTE